MSEDEARWTPDLAERDDDVESPVYVGFLSEVQSGDKRRALSAIRNRLAEELNMAEGKEIAPIAGALLKTLEALERVPDLAQADPVNEIAARRERRRREHGLDETAAQ